jgi:hypothetical protein
MESENDIEVKIMVEDKNVWKRYPEDQPPQGMMGLLIINKWGRVYDGFCYWDSKDSQHEHSCWKNAKWWCRKNDLSLTLPEAERSKFEIWEECDLCEGFAVIYGYVTIKGQSIKHACCKKHFDNHLDNPEYICEKKEPICVK